jgi:DmsE family decaheme c-type cytochrome
MRILKLVLVLLFVASLSVPFVSKQLAALGRGDKAPKPVETKAERKAEKIAAKSAEKGENTQLPFSSDSSLYVGSNSCVECHANQAAHYATTAHRKNDLPDAKAELVGCEACHGGAKTHVEFYQAAQKLAMDGKDTESQAMLNDTEKVKAASLVPLSKISPAAASASCLKCHEGSQGRNEERFNYRRSEHGRHGVSCIDCHSSHSPKRTEFLLRDDEPEGCYKCHQDQKAAFAKPFHHKVPEGNIKCSDCHNQHGGFQAKQLRSWAGGDNSCMKCHTDKAGPFAFEHAPIKVEGCQACHTPHGSTNPKMLKRNEVRFLCLECHSNAPGLNLPEEGVGLGPPTPSFHDITQPRIQNCTACHFTIHGSNMDRFFRR